MTEKQKDRRSLIVTVSVLLTFSILFSVFYFAVLPIVNNAMIESRGIGVYIYYNLPQTLEEYNELITKKSKASLAEVEPSFWCETNLFFGLSFGYTSLGPFRRYAPQYVIPFDEKRDCFIGEFRGENGSEGNYVAILHKPYEGDNSYPLICQRPANAPTIEEFTEIYPSLTRGYLFKERTAFGERFGGWFDLSFGGEGISEMYLLLKDGVVVISIRASHFTISEIYTYSSVDEEVGLPLTKLIDLFNEHERSEGK